MNQQIIIRKEKPEDYRSVEHLVMRAFWNIHCPGCNEHYLAYLLRSSGDYLPELSRIAECDGRIIGAIFYSKAVVVDGEHTNSIVTFGPLAVEPTAQNTGVGRMLLEETLALAKEAGYPGVCILGEPHYYPKRGFRTCDHYGITDAYGNNYDALMALPLNEKAFSKVHGKLIESSVFDQCNDPEALAAFDKLFPQYPKVKLQDGFLMLFDKRIGKVVSEHNGKYRIRFWEQELPAELDAAYDTQNGGPNPGDWVLFSNYGEDVCTITELCRNLLEGTD